MELLPPPKPQHAGNSNKQVTDQSVHQHAYARKNPGQVCEFMQRVSDPIKAYQGKHKGGNHPAQKDIF